MQGAGCQIGMEMRAELVVWFGCAQSANAAWGSSEAAGITVGVARGGWAKGDVGYEGGWKEGWEGEEDGTRTHLADWSETSPSLGPSFSSTTECGHLSKPTQGRRRRRKTRHIISFCHSPVQHQ